MIVQQAVDLHSLIVLGLDVLGIKLTIVLFAVVSNFLLPTSNFLLPNNSYTVS